ncbi:MAG: 4-amino-4-deoxy-L-arabinose transferase [Desulfobulbaceae bacterium]|nr:4-amino-4-deoxy-L-arabinose transferase [Desulfobulbaceae bacterium]
MTLAAFAFIITGVLLNAAAQLALKASVHEMGAIVLTLDTLAPVAWRLARQPWLWAGLSCYGISVVVWILALSRVDVTIAYPMLSIGYVVSAVAAWMLFGETLTAGRLTGIGVIIVGVCILARS